MATSTIVFTFTPAVAEGTGEKGISVDSFTVEGTAYASLTAALVREAFTLFKAGQAALLRDAKVPSGGMSDRAITS
jgi:hypothetical protein